MSAPKLYLPMLNGLMLGEAMSSHDGVRCYPAIRHSNQEKYIVKVISVPSSQVQLDALLLTGAFPSREAALEYYMDVSRDMLRETEILRQLSHQEGFIPYLDAQIISNDDFTGYEVYLLGSFKRSAERIFQSEAMTHQGIIRMGLDLCAALAACRREGYIYVDLKPGNIFYSEEQGYRIGDVGFASMASLAYASLPEKYRSRYTAPELLDEMAVLNETVDVYALGLVLYQAYNGGVLPELADGQPLPTPLYADYEFADIILRACHPDPSKRWKDPTALAQAIISYVQRNHVSDESIIPAVPDEIPEEPEQAEDFLPEADPEELSREIAALEGTEYEEMAFLSDLGRSSADDETAIADMPLSEEISEMLAQADELIAHELPEPAVAPAPVEVPIPEPIALEDASKEAPAEEISEIPAEEPPEMPPEEQQPQQEQPQAEKKPPVGASAAPRPKRQFPWKLMIAITLIVVLLSSAFTGYYYYCNYYLQNIDDMILEHNGDVLSVKVVTSADPSLLTVYCSDSYGNTQRQSVAAGVAIFTDLDPQTHYSVRVEISGFHKLTGTVSDSFTTAAQTQITELSAGIGSEDGSVVIRFRTEGPQVSNWIMTYSAPDTEERTVTFQGNSVQLRDLRIGSEYTFTLSREDGQSLAGQTQVQYTAGRILLPENLRFVSCGNGQLTIQWDAPDGSSDILWTVRCYNSAGYNQCITTSDTQASFNGMAHDVPCTVDVTAEGMTQWGSVTITANPITVGQFHFDVMHNGMLSVTWDYSGTEPASWVLEYTIDGAAMKPVATFENNASILLIPGAEYHLNVTAHGAGAQFGGNCHYSCPEAEPFQGYGITAEDLQSQLCLRPSQENWTAADVPEDQYVSVFTPGQKAGLVIRRPTAPEASADRVTIRLVFRDSTGKVINALDIPIMWDQLWANGDYAADIRWLPVEAGEYSIRLYIDDQYVEELAFSITGAQ